MRIVHFIKQPLNQRDRRRFGIDAFLRRGHQVTVFDVSDIMHPDLENRRDPPLDTVGLDIVQPASWAAVKAEADTLHEADLVVLLIQSHGLSPAMWHPMRIVKTAGTPYLTLAPNLYPRLASSAGGGDLVTWGADLGRRLASADLLNSVLARIPARRLGLPTARWHVVNGRKSRARNNLVGPATQCIEACSQDVDVWLELRNTVAPVMKQAVFIDQFVHRHPDAQAAGLSHRIDPEAYFRDLCRYFDWFERETGLEIVVAAHPRADYDRERSPFGDRRIEWNRTAALIAESQVVLAHMSTSIGLAVLFRRPVVIVTSPGLLAYFPHHRAVYLGFAQVLMAPLIDIEDRATWPRSLAREVDESAYATYEADYLRAPGTPDRPMWDIVGDALGA